MKETFIKTKKQAGAELDQAQIKLGLDFTSIKICWGVPDSDDRLVSVHWALKCHLELSLANYSSTVYSPPKPANTITTSQYDHPKAPLLSSGTPSRLLQLHNTH